jgi:hypothetical protein
MCPAVPWAGDCYTHGSIFIGASAGPEGALRIAPSGTDRPFSESQAW